MCAYVICTRNICFGDKYAVSQHNVYFSTEIKLRKLKSRDMHSINNYVTFSVTETKEKYSFLGFVDRAS